MTKTEKSILNGGGLSSESVTLHSLNRFKSRVGISDPKEIKKLVDDAIKYGKRRIKSNARAIEVKYKGLKFVFAKNSRKLITIYKSEEDYGK